jgi:hypothetical protein
MATFYLLPSPRFLGQAFERHLHLLFPGLCWEESTLALVVDQVSAAVALHPNAYLIQRHELPEDEDPIQALIDAFGAEPGDEVVELHAGARLGEWRIRRRLVPQAA